MKASKKYGKTLAEREKRVDNYCEELERLTKKYLAGLPETPERRRALENRIKVLLIKTAVGGLDRKVFYDALKILERLKKK